MKDGLICGMILGIVAGMFIYKHSPDAKQIVNKTEEAVKKELNNMSSEKKSAS